MGSEMCIRDRAYLLLSNPWGWLITLGSAVVLVALTRHRRRRAPTLREGEEPVRMPAAVGRGSLLGASPTSDERGEP